MEPSAQFLKELEDVGRDPYMMGEAAVSELQRQGMFPISPEGQINLAIRIGATAAECTIRGESPKRFADTVFNIT